MLPGHNDDVDRPERACVVKGEYIIGLDDDLDLRSAADHFVAVEVICHASSVADQPPPASEPLRYDASV